MNMVDKMLEIVESFAQTAPHPDDNEKTKGDVATEHKLELGINLHYDWVKKTYYAWIFYDDTHIYSDSYVTHYEALAELEQKIKNTNPV